MRDKSLRLTGSGSSWTATRAPVTSNANRNRLDVAGLAAKDGFSVDRSAVECGISRRAGTLAMRREGHLRQSTWAKGEWTDDLLYALLHEEWQTGRG